jgi:8-oxo-dGTP diphosphatase
VPRLPDGEELPVAPIVVTAAIVERDGEYLLTRRPKGVHLAGLWEFPGGKCEPHETLSDCLRRELAEELGVDATVGDELFAVTHAYPDRVIELHFLRCELIGNPTPQLGQEMRWVPRDVLTTLEFPPADAELIRTLSEA